MERIDAFKEWLDANSEYTKETRSNIVSRLRRADKLLPITEDPVYLFNLSQRSDFNALTVTVKSQIRRAVRIYHHYLEIEGHHADE